MLFEQIGQDILAAMKAKDKVRTLALRNVKKLFIEAKTAPGANDSLEDAAALKILQKLVKQGEDTAALYTTNGRADLAAEEMAQVEVIRSYLPKQISVGDLEAALKEIIVKVGATGPRDMGKVMGMAQKELSGKADGKAIADTVKKLLGM